LSSYTGTDNLEIMHEAVNYNRFLERLVFKHARPGDRILDFGAGIGTFATRVRDAGFAVSCIEVDEQQADSIRQAGIETASQTGEFPAESFEYVYSLNVLEHIEYDAQALREIFSCVAPGGIVLIYVPALQFLFSSMDEKVGHYRRYSRKSLTQVTQAAGFTVKSCRYADSLGVLATLLYKLSDNRSGTLNKTALILYDRLAFPISRLLDLALNRVCGKNVYVVLEKAK
jgi:2-polyprenyl-3-methyl-5-hydroxy-6-metoxy-1,4-benzoquinol methylase